MGVLLQIQMQKSEGFTLGFYFQALSGVVGAPRQFFSDLPDPVGLRRPLGFLLVSSLFFAVASFTCFRENHWLLSSIFLVNALLMPFIAAGIAFMVMLLIVERCMPFERLFAIYAFAGGVTLLVSWIPFSNWLTEPWKWILIGLGMVKGGGLTWRQTILILGLSLALLILLFRALFPVAAFLRELAS